MTTQWAVRAMAALILGAQVLWSSPLHASPWYHFDLVAESGAGGFTGFGDSVSVNDKGEVAFVGQLAIGESIFFGKGTGAAPVNATPGFASSTRRFGRAVQITRDSKILGRDQVSGAPIVTFIRIWDPATSTNTVVARGGTLFQDFDAVFAFPSTNNVGQTVLSALDGAQTVLATKAFIGFNTVNYSGIVRPAIADDGRIAVTLGTGAANDPLLLYRYDLSSAETIAASANFSVIGRRPGISDDGRVVVFFGDLSAAGALALGIPAGPGIFASVDLGGGSRQLLRLTGRKAETMGTGGNGDGVCDTGETCHNVGELGFDEAGATRFFSGYDAGGSVSVTNLDLGVAGIDGDTFTVSFIATPNSASRGNPRVAGKPLFYSNQKGIWTVRVQVRRGLAGAGSRVFNVGFPVPVVQVNDVINGTTVADFALYDSIANAAQDDAGNLRTMRNGEHRVAFWCLMTGGASKIVRASQLDSDQDGIYDHWETGGIDIDDDGTRDLDLAAMGANVNQRDVFLELDWLANQPLFKFEPAPGVISPMLGSPQSPLVAMFANAPALSGANYGVRSDGAAPQDIVAGITLHIDGGPGNDQIGLPLSLNMGAASLQGGDRIGMPGNSSALIDVLYFGVPGSVTVAGVNTRAMAEVKDVFFSTTDKRARELAFHYIVLGAAYTFITDAAGAPFTSTVTAATNTGTPSLTSAAALPGGATAGHIVYITSGVGAGQKRNIVAVGANFMNVNRPWTTVPGAGSTFVLISGSSGRGEVDFQPSSNNHAFGGNDLAVTLGGFGISGGFVGNACFQWQTIAHELGHTLGLRHGGTDHNPFKGVNYLSLMSYSHQNTCPPGAVVSYSTAGDPTFDDFANLVLDFQGVQIHLGNTFGLGLGGTAVAEAVEPEQTLHDVETLHGPVDVEAPSIVIVAPAAGSSIALGGNFLVSVTVADNKAVENVWIEFDTNGNGSIEASERIAASKGAGGAGYTTMFNGVSGGAGSRAVKVIATDPSTNLQTASVDVQVTSGAVIVPDVVGKTLAAATSDLTAAGLFTSVINVASSTVPRGVVISELPPAGSSVTPGSVVTLSVSSGPACADNVSAQIGVARSGFTLNRTTNRYVQRVTLTNKGTGPIAGPLALALDNLSSTARLANAVGSTACAVPVSPYVVVNVGADSVLSVGESASVTLEFSNPTNQSILYSTRVLSGTSR